MIMSVGFQRQTKARLPHETLWVRIIAVHNDKLQAIGILMNKPMINKSYNWGDFVRLKQDKPNEYPNIISKAGKIPNMKTWRMLS